MGRDWWGSGGRTIRLAVIAIGLGPALAMAACRNDDALGGRWRPDAAPAPAASDASASGGRAAVDAAPNRDFGGDDRTTGAGGTSGQARPDAAIVRAPDAGGIIRTDAGLPPVCPAAGSPPPASVDSVGTCGASLSTGDTLRLGPALAGQTYLRCGTVGSETTWQVTLSPDASRLAALTSSGTVRLFATDDWHEIAQLASPIGQLDAAVFSPDGTALATVSRELGAVMLWRPDNGQLIRSVTIPAQTTIGDPKSALTFAADGRRLVTSLDAIVDLSTGTVTDWVGNPIASGGPARTDMEVARDITHLMFPDQLRLVGCETRLLVQARYPAGNAGTAPGVRLFDPTGGRKGVSLAGGLYAEIGGVAASNDGRWVALASYSDDPPPKLGLGLYDAGSGALYVSDGSATGQLVGFSPDGTELYMATTFEIVVRAVPTLAVLRRLPLPAGGKLMAISPLGPLIVSTTDASLWLDPSTGAVLRQVAFPISAPTFSADGRYGASSGGGSALFHLWRETDATALCGPAAPPAGAAVATVALSPDGRTLGLGRADGTVELHDIELNGEVGPLQGTVATGFIQPVYSALRLANHGTRMAVVGTLNPVELRSKVGVFDQTGRMLFGRPISPYGPPELQLALSPDGGEVAYVDGGGGIVDAQQINAASVDSNAVIFTKPLAGPLTGIDSFSADGSRLALPAVDGMEIWRLSDGQEEAAVGSGGGQTWAVAFSPSWKYLAEPTFPPTGLGIPDILPYLEIWDPVTGSELARIDQLDLDSSARVDDTGTVVVADEMVTHTLVTSWYAPFVYDLASATETRMFRTTSDEWEPALPFAGGARIVTRLGSALALWCR